ncbi:MAG: ATP-binding cassette domain-containing protein [Acidimicrobiales bacterium]
MPELVVDQVSVRFGGVSALDDVSLHVRPSSVHGLIGPNGAGKTTLFNVVTGLQPPTRGRVRLGDRDITRTGTHVRTRLGIARTFQRLEVCGTLTAVENVQLAAEARRADRRRARARAEELLERVGALSVADEPADALPTGTARLVELARALATDPSVLLLDEPSSGLDESETAALGRVLGDLRDGGMAVLLVEHDMGLVMQVCDHLDVLDYGAVIASGAPVEVAADPAVQTAYLGTSGEERPSPARARDVAPVPDGRPPAVAVHDLRAAYGRIEVLHGVTLEVPAGGACALLGPNGAGKSTLLKVLSGSLAPTGGRAEVDGVDTAKLAPERLARRGICSVPEGRAIFPNLTVTENLTMCTYRGPGVKVADLEARTFERFPRLAQRRKQLAGSLSGGEQQMLALARALYTEPTVLLLDEISMGLAPLVVAELYGLVGELVGKEGLTIVLVEQFAQAALAIATQAAVLVNGRIVKHGDPQTVGASLAETYLGAPT